MNMGWLLFVDVPSLGQIKRSSWISFRCFDDINIVLLNKSQSRC